MNVQVRNKKDLLKVIKAQINLIEKNQFDSKELNKNSVFKNQGKWINDFVKINIPDLKPLKYKFYNLKVLLKSFLKYFFLFLLFFTMMWNSYFSKSYYNGGWKSLSNFENHLLDITSILLYLFILAFIVFYFYTKFYFHTKKRSSRTKNNKSIFMMVFNYSIFLMELKKKTENLPEVEIMNMLRKI